MRTTLAVTVMVLFASAATLEAPDTAEVTDLGEQKLPEELSVSNLVTDIINTDAGDERKVGEGQDGGALENHINTFAKDMAMSECIQMSEVQATDYCFNRTEAHCNGDMKDWFCDFEHVDVYGTQISQWCDDRYEFQCTQVNVGAPDQIVSAKCCSWDAAIGNCSYSNTQCV